MADVAFIALTIGCFTVLVLIVKGVAQVSDAHRAAHGETAGTPHPHPAGGAADRGKR
ncbi:hypothetical protein H7827_21600 [Streptomyces sp. JH002]|uniref:hypothetical protein n=1 Tax=Streptomyces TaxID=1883 RepID=UPI0036BD64E9